MRMLAWAAAGLTAASSLAAQQSAVATVSLVARKAAVVGLAPAEVQLAGLSPAIDVAASPGPSAIGVVAVWNLPPEQVGDLRLRTTRGASLAGASYIERRVILLDPVARLRHDLEPHAAHRGAPDALAVVRLVVY